MNDRSQNVVSCHGVRVPRLIYGTAWKKDQTAVLVEQALAMGFRGIDTACQPKHYSEAGVGEGLSAALGPGLTRSEVYVQTKFTPTDGHDPKQIPYDPRRSLEQQVHESFAVSLRNLGTDYVDGLVLHSPLRSQEDTLEAWRAMEMLADDGRARQLGISNLYRVDELEDLWERARIKPAIVQNRFYANTGYDREIRAFCRDRGALYQGFWTLTANHAVLVHNSLQVLAAHYRRTPAQIFYRYLTQIGVIPLIGTTSTTHMREDLAIFEFELRESECHLIGDLLDRHDRA